MTNIYVVQSADGAAETYTPYFAAGGFRFAQLSGLPADHNLTPDQVNGLLTQLQVRLRL